MHSAHLSVTKVIINGSERADIKSMIGKTTNEETFTILIKLALNLSLSSTILLNTGYVTVLIIPVRLAEGKDAN